MNRRPVPSENSTCQFSWPAMPYGVPFRTWTSVQPGAAASSHATSEPLIDTAASSWRASARGIPLASTDHRLPLSSVKNQRW
jgi:hypothetical protein